MTHSHKLYSILSYTVSQIVYFIERRESNTETHIQLRENKDPCINLNLKLNKGGRGEADAKDAS